MPVTLHLEGGVGTHPAPAGQRARLPGHPLVGVAGSCLLLWGCPGRLGFSSLSAQDAACSRTGRQGRRCCRGQRRTHRLLYALRGDGSSAAGLHWHFAGDARGGTPGPEKERCSDSPHASLLTLCKRCLCLEMQCLASVRVRKGNAAVLPRSGLAYLRKLLSLQTLKWSLFLWSPQQHVTLV